MDCGLRRCFTARQPNPILAVPVIKAVIPNAAFGVVIPLTHGLDERDSVEALLLFQIYFQPARGLCLIQAPARPEVAIVRLIRSHGIRVGTGANGLALCQILRRDHDMLAELWHWPSMPPCLANLFQAAHDVG